MCSGRLWGFKEKKYCELCGGAEIRRRYLRYAWAVPDHACGVLQMHLCCTCPSCGYQWGEEGYEQWRSRAALATWSGDSA